MEIEQVAIEGLIPYARNARTHSAEQVAQIAASIREFGFTNPVLVDGDGGIIAGHCRVMAARKLGIPRRHASVSRPPALPCAQARTPVTRQRSEVSRTPDHRR